MKIRSRSSNFWVYVVIGAAGILAVVVIFSLWLLWRLITVEDSALFLTLEAYKNRWFAISKLSENYGISVHVDSNLMVEDMPLPSDVVILEDSQSAVVDESTSVALEKWVLQGGTLIYRVPVVFIDEDPLSTIESRFFPNKFMIFEQRERSLFDDLLRFVEPMRKQPCTSRTLPIWFADGDVATHEWKSSPHLDTSMSPLAEDIVTLSQMHFLRVNWGDGLVYFITDLGLWSNHFAECADNAYVFLRMVRGSLNLMPGRASEVAVWIVPPARIKTPHLLNLVWDNYHIPIIGILLTFLVAIIARNIRSSPAIHAIPIPRRATIDYVTSVSEFAWRRNDINRFFQAFLWVIENPKGVFGPRTTATTIQKSEQNNSDKPDLLNDTPTNEEDLVVNVRKMQAKLRQNMQPSLRKS